MQDIVKRRSEQEGACFFRTRGPLFTTIALAFLAHDA